MPGQCAGIDAFNSWNFGLSQIFPERHLRSPVAWSFAQFFDNESPNVWRAAFLIHGVGSVIAYQRIGHGHDLTAIRRISQHLLVASHGSVKTNFADARTGRAKRLAFKGSAVFESNQGAHGGRSLVD